MLTLLSQFSFGFIIRGAVIAQLEEILEIRYRFRVELGNNGSVKSQCLKNKDIFQNFATSETLKNIWGYNFSKINQHYYFCLERYKLGYVSHPYSKVDLCSLKSLVELTKTVGWLEPSIRLLNLWKKSKIF